MEPFTVFIPKSSTQASYLILTMFLQAICHIEVKNCLDQSMAAMAWRMTRGLCSSNPDSGYALFGELICLGDWPVCTVGTKLLKGPPMTDSAGWLHPQPDGGRLTGIGM